MKLFSQNLKEFRKINNLTQEDFANILGIKRPRLASYEEERVEPPIKLFLEICDHCKIHPKLFYETELNRLITEDGVKERKVRSVKKYTFELINYNDGTCDMNRENNGFSMIELLGILTLVKDHLLNLITSNLKPVDEINLKSSNCPLIH